MYGKDEKININIITNYNIYIINNIYIIKVIKFNNGKTFMLDVRRVDGVSEVFAFVVF